MNDESMEERLSAFKMRLLRTMPFYGDILTNIPIISDASVPTACTDGRTIRFNPAFFKSHTIGEQHFIIMHEVMHILLLHCVRGRGKDVRLYNTAADIIANSEVKWLVVSMQSAGIEIEAPKDGIYRPEYQTDTVEEVYGKLCAANREQKGKKEPRKVNIYAGRGGGRHTIKVDSPDDLAIPLPGEGAFSEETGLTQEGGLPAGTFSEDSSEAIEKHVAALIRHAEEVRKKDRSPYGSYYVPNALFALTESRHLPWKRLLRDLMTDRVAEDVSYATPERKYLHMELILPGHGEREDTLENVWAFVDSSGSIGKTEMDEFLTQLYRIVKEFRCKMNLAYWDTEVTEVYRNIRGEANILQSVPRHSGGTDINCVYRWIAENKVKPDVMIILTDGYYGALREENRIPSLRKKTILVLSRSGILINDNIKKLGKVAKL